MHADMTAAGLCTKFTEDVSMQMRDTFQHQAVLLSTLYKDVSGNMSQNTLLVLPQLTDCQGRF